MPPKNKKGSKKGSKKKKDESTVAERNAITRQKMAAEKDKRYHRKRLTKLFLKVKQDREYTLMKSAQQEVLTQWRPFMRKSRNDELLKEFKLMQAAFERSFDKKNELIKNLEDQLEKNCKDYDDAFDNHMYNVDKMFEFFKTRIMDVKQLYASTKQYLMDILNAENARMDESHIKGMKFLLSVKDSAAIAIKVANEEWKMMVKLEEEQISSKAMEDAMGVTVIFGEKIDEVWLEIQKRLISYDRAMNPLREEYFKLRKVNDDSSDTIENHRTRIQVLEIGLASLENRIDAIKFATHSQLKELMEKKKNLREKYNEKLQRHRFHTRKSGQAVRVLALTVHSLGAKMDEHMNKRERLMLVIERSRKLERMNEKVDPFMTHMAIGDLDDNFEADIESTRLFYGANEEEIRGETEYIMRVPFIQHTLTCECDPCICEIAAEDDAATNLNAPLNKLVNDYALMEKFWIRHNRCSLEIAALTDKRNYLVRDNADFKITLRNYMGGLNPLEHDPEKITKKALNDDKKEYVNYVHFVRKEYNRRQRSRKVGGIRMH